MTDKTKPLEDPPASPPVHDRSKEPAGGYRHAEERGSNPKGWREMDPGEEESPAAPEGRDD